MARKRNEQSIAAIRAAARASMLEQGYEATTYSELAERTGLARTTVQHYVPSKEVLATKLMQEISAAAYNRARSLLPEDAPALEIFYVAGQIACGIYYSTPGLRQLLHDILADRRLEHSALPRFDVEGLKLLGLIKGDVDEAARDEIALAFGGTYEMHFVCLEEGRMPNARRLHQTLVITFGRISGMSKKNVADILERSDIGNDRLLEIGREIADELARS